MRSASGRGRDVDAEGASRRTGERAVAVARDPRAGRAASRRRASGHAAGADRSASPPAGSPRAGRGTVPGSVLLLILSLSLLTAASACGNDPVDLSGDRAAPGESEAAPAAPAYPGEEPAPASVAGEESATEPSAEPAAAEPEAPPPVDAVRIYLVDLEAGAAIEDGEPAADSFGCGDRLRAVEVPVATEGLDTAERIAAALGALLAGAEPRAGLYDALARSQLAVDSVEALPGVPGVFRVHLTGELTLGGVCDHPRVRAQLEATARQFPGVEEVELLLSGEPLDAVLTGRG